MGVDAIVPIILTILFIVSFIMAVRSMKDLKFGHEVSQMVFKKKMKGSIVFFDQKVVHYKGHKK
jgi:hypothetical protein